MQNHKGFKQNLLKIILLLVLKKGRFINLLSLKFVIFLTFIPNKKHGY
jgi:hypothetical protein